MSSFDTLTIEETREYSDYLDNLEYREFREAELRETAEIDAKLAVEFPSYDELPEATRQEIDAKNPWLVYSQEFRNAGVPEQYILAKVQKKISDMRKLEVKRENALKEKLAKEKRMAKYIAHYGNKYNLDNEISVFDE